MINVVLSVDDYNKLFKLSLAEYNFCLVRKNDNYVTINTIYDEIIAKIRVNTAEGKILIRYTNCFLKVIKNSGVISLCKECFSFTNDDSENCIIDGGRYTCKFDEQLKQLDRKIEDIRFIDPLQNKDYEIVKKMKKYREKISGIRKELEYIKSIDVLGINIALEKVEYQINNLLQKWDNEIKHDGRR